MNLSMDELIDIDVVNGLKELGENDEESFFKEIIGLYEQEAQNLIDEIKSLASKGDADMLGKTAHTLKGASLNVGAKLFAAVCKNIEMAGKQNELAGIENEINRLDELNELTLEALKNQF